MELLVRLSVTQQWWSPTRLNSWMQSHIGRHPLVILFAKTFASLSPLYTHTHTHTCTHTHTHTHTHARTQPQRSDYLHRKLYEALSDIPNVYFPTWRMATIWGGASLLQMLLRSMEDLEYVLTDWKWDYLINLSESDFPLQWACSLIARPPGLQFLDTVSDQKLETRKASKWGKWVCMCVWGSSSMLKQW